MKFLVNIREILEREVEIEAESMLQAEEEAEKQYKEEKIVLNENDYKGTEISVQQMRKIREEELEDAKQKQEEKELDKESGKIKSGVDSRRRM